MSSPPASSNDSELLRFAWERSIRSAGLGVRPTLIGLALATYADNDGGSVYPSLSGVAKGLGVSENFVRSGRTDLTNAGWLVLVERRFRPDTAVRLPDVYRLAIPAAGAIVGPSSGEGGSLSTEGTVPHHVKDGPSPHEGRSLTTSGEQNQLQAPVQAQLPPTEQSQQAVDPHSGYPCPRELGQPCRLPACPYFEGEELTEVTFSKTERGGDLTVFERAERRRAGQAEPAGQPERYRPFWRDA